jgi:hypothetical protein
MVPQTKFSLNTSATRTDGTPLAPGDIVQINLQIAEVINGVPGPVSTYSFPVPATQVPGSALDLPFASLTPPFAPVAGKTYQVDADDQDKNGLQSGWTNQLVWTQAFAAPSAPTGFSVA